MRGRSPRASGRGLSLIFGFVQTFPYLLIYMLPLASDFPIDVPVADRRLL